MELNRTPLYLQIVELLRHELHNGIYPTDTRFPSERDLADRFSISRATANKILSVLVSEGALQHRKGVGAFVSLPPLEHDMSALLSFTEKAKSSGVLPETRILEMHEAPHPVFGTALYLLRQRFADGMPAILEKRWLRASLCGGLTREAVSGSLYQAFSDTLGLSVGRAEQTVRAILPTAAERKRLDLRSGVACLRVEGEGYLADGTLLWTEDTLFRGDLFAFHAILGASGTRATVPQGPFLATLS